MSGSQEAASALRILEQDRAQLFEKRRALEQQVVELGAKVREARAKADALQREVESKMAENSMVNRELGRVEGAIAAFNGPRGYGGAPVLRSGQASDRLYRTPVRRVR